MIISKELHVASSATSKRRVFPWGIKSGQVGQPRKKSTVVIARSKATKQSVLKSAT